MSTYCRFPRSSTKLKEGPREKDAKYEAAIEKYKSHLEHRTALHKAFLEVSGRFSQWVLTLAGGALALSITYVEKLQPELNETARALLVMAWAAFGMSLFSSLLSLYFSSCATCQAIKDHDQAYKVSLGSADPIAKKVNQHSQWTDLLAIIGLIAFALGIGFMCAFVISCPPKSPPITPHENATASPKTATLKDPSPAASAIETGAIAN